MLNKVQIIGRLGNDPEIRYAPSGDAIANLSVATSESWKDKNSGERKEKTEWHRIVVFGKLAEVVGEYLRKGSLAYFEGKLVTRKWQDNNGQDRYTTEISVDSFSGTMRMLEGRQSNDNSGGQQQRSAPASTQPPQTSTQNRQPSRQNTIDDDDIPF